MVELRDILFYNVADILKLEPDPSQQKFVESVSYTIALAYAGINESCSGFASAIYFDEEPVGIILVGKIKIDKKEPKILQQYQYAYRLMGFFIDKKYQHKGIGKAALSLVLDKLIKYPDIKSSPLILEVHKENLVAIKLYESFGFINTGILLKDNNYILLKHIYN